MTLGIGSNQVTRLSRMILCIQLEISQRRGTRSCNRLSLRRCPRHCTYTFGTISLIRLSMYRSGALHNMGKGTCFHLKPRLSERVQWPTFVQRRPAAYYVIDLPSVEAARDLQHCHC